MTNIRLFLSQPHACGYHAEREAQDLVVDPEWLPNATGYTALSSHGYRRSGGYIYKPNCAECNACLASRIPVRRFLPNRSQKRCLKANSDISVTLVSAGSTQLNSAQEPSGEHFQLYRRYQNNRHQGGSMANPTADDYENFLFNNWTDTQLIECRLDSKLVAVAVTDQLQDGLSAVYSFFDPDLPKRSLGTYCILQQVSVAQASNLEYLYLGYWISDSDKMRYKTNFRPIQILQGEQWCEYSKQQLITSPLAL